MSTDQKYLEDTSENMLGSALGKFRFLNREPQIEKDQILLFVWSEFPIDDATRRLMNRAARATDGVIGVKVIGHPSGTRFALLLERDVAEENVLPTALRWAARFREDSYLIHQDDEGHNVVTYTTPAMVEYAPVDAFHNYNS